MKRTFYQNVPSPVTFFQPLYSVHNGNFQVCDATLKGLPDSAQDVGFRQGMGEGLRALVSASRFLVHIVGLNLHTVSQMGKKKDLSSLRLTSFALVFLIPLLMSTFSDIISVFSGSWQRL